MNTFCASADLKFQTVFSTMLGALEFGQISQSWLSFVVFFFGGKIIDIEFMQQFVATLVY